MARIFAAMHTIDAAYRDLRSALLFLYDDGEASAIAHSAMEHLTGLTRLQRLSQKDILLSSGQREHLESAKAALLSGQPLQYVVGHAYFLDRPFLVSPAVLIPRPETEELVEWIVAERKPLSLLDIGTGSGCIAISLKLALAGCSVSAIDISVDALAIARQNAQSLGAEVTFEQLDFLNFNSRNALPRFDVIVSNPPYIPFDEADSLHQSVREHEPGTALFVPKADPLLFYREIAAFGRTHLVEGGAVYCELHRDFAERTAELFRECGYGDVALREDIHGAPRMLRAALS